MDPVHQAGEGLVNFRCAAEETGVRIVIEGIIPKPKKLPVHGGQSSVCALPLWPSNPSTATSLHHNFWLDSMVILCGWMLQEIVPGPDPPITDMGKCVTGGASR